MPCSALCCCCCGCYSFGFRGKCAYELEKFILPNICKQLYLSPYADVPFIYCTCFVFFLLVSNAHEGAQSECKTSNSVTDTWVL